jgi:hypothetical protein
VHTKRGPAPTVARSIDQVSLKHLRDWTPDGVTAKHVPMKKRTGFETTQSELRGKFAMPDRVLFRGHLALRDPRVRGNHTTHRLEIVRRWRQCLHFYFLDPELGFMHVRLQSWLPFTVQICQRASAVLSFRQVEFPQAFAAAA